MRWRALFDYLGVSWRDRGANTSSGHINVRCPWCRDDPSFHLAINENTGRYRCYRSSAEHAGRSAPYLLRALGVHSISIDTLIEQFASRSSDRVIPASSKPVIDYQVFEGNWQQFLPISNTPYEDYWKSRVGMSYKTGWGFDLRYAPYGRHAARLLMPLRYEDGMLQGFIGRAIRPGIVPKYLFSAGSASDLVYVPRPPVGEDAVIVVEGPLDALKIAVATSQILPIAMLGLNFSPRKVARLADYCKSATKVFVAVDADQPVSTAYKIISNFSSGVRWTHTTRLPVPPPYKDAGDMPIEEIREWIKQALSQPGRDF